MKTLQQKIAELPLDNQQTVTKRYQKLKQMFLTGKYIIPDTKDLVKELNNFNY